MIEIKDGMLKVTAFYSLKVPVNEGGFAMQDVGCSYGFEVALPDNYDMDRLAKDASTAFAQLQNGAKLAVYAQLDTNFDTLDGVLKPIVREAPRTQKAAQQRQGSGQRTQGGGQRQAGGSRQFAPPKAAGRTLPVVHVDGRDFYDQRPLKADGTYKPGAADFKSVEPGPGGKPAQLWLYDKNGDLNDGVADLLDAAGVPWGDAYEAAVDVF